MKKCIGQMDDYEKTIIKINYKFINSDRQREIIDKLMPGTFDDNLPDRVNSLIFLKSIKENGRYEELLNELKDT